MPLITVPIEQKRAALVLLAAGKATVSEIAALVGTHRQTVDRWCRYGVPGGADWWRSHGVPGGTVAPPLNLDAREARRRWLREQWAQALGGST